MAREEIDNETMTSRRDVLKATSAAAIGLASFAGGSAVGSDAASATSSPTSLGRLEHTVSAHSVPIDRQFNVISYGADPTGVADSSKAVAAAQAALKAAHGGDLFFPPGGTYRFQTGIIRRVALADSHMSITAANTILKPFGSGIGIDTEMIDPAYWAQPITPPMAPVVWGVMDCAGLTSGAVGIRHSITVGAYYDGLVHNASARPDAGWPSSGRPGARGWQIRNTQDSKGVKRWTEQTLFGPNCGVHNCYIGIEFDTYNGGNSFGYTKMSRFIIECNVVAQRAIVVRATGGVPAQLYGSQFEWQGNSTVSGSTSLLGTLSGSLTPATLTTSIVLSTALSVAAYDGEIVILRDAAGLNPQAAMVHGNNPVGSKTVTTYQFSPTNSFSGGTFESAPAACVVGWPATSSPGWIYATSTVPSNLRKSTLNWQMESGGSTLPVRTCPLYVSTGATVDVFGYVDVVTYSTGLVQNYGTLIVNGDYEGHPVPTPPDVDVDNDVDVTTAYLGASIPSVASICLGQSMARVQINDNNTLSLVSGQPTLVALSVAAGTPISYLGWYAGATGAAGVTNHWLGLLDANFNLVATTSDLGATVSAKTAYGGAIATTAAVPAASYTPSVSGVMYVAICVVATSMPTVTGARLVSAAISGSLGGGPILCASSTDTLSAPPSYPFTSTPGSDVAAIPYVWVAGAA